MNYRHAYHAGNFADLLKHGVLTQVLRALTASPGPLMIFDTHAGAGLYDLSGEAALRTGEADAGVRRLIAAVAAPAAFDDLLAVVRSVNAPDEARYYPGSPAIVAAAMCEGDRFIACEIRDDDAGALKDVLARRSGATVVQGDGWAIALERAPGPPDRLLVLIDPPFERPDDADRAIELTGDLLARNRSAVIAIWVPIKDLTNFDALMIALGDAAEPAPLLAAEIRLRPLTDPMKLNGCAMIVINPPPGLDAAARAVADWIVDAVGEPGGSARIERIAP